MDAQRIAVDAIVVLTGCDRDQVADFIRRGLRTFGADSRELLSRPMSTAISTSAGCPTLWS